MTVTFPSANLPARAMEGSYTPLTQQFHMEAGVHTGASIL